MARIQELKTITFRSLWLRLLGKQKAKLDEEEKRFLKDHHEEALAEKSLEGIQSQLDDAQTAFTELKVRKEFLDICRNEMDCLLLNAKNIHCDDDLEKQVGDLLTRLTEIETFKSKSNQCLKHLLAAEMGLMNANMLLKRAQYEINYNLWDPFAFPSIDDDAYAYSDIARATRYLHRAHRDIRIAIELGPNTLPVITETQVYHKNYILYDAFFDNYYTEESITTDLAYKRDEIKDSISSVVDAIHFMRNMLIQVEKDHSEAITQLNLKRNELLVERRNFIENFLVDEDQKTFDQKIQPEVFTDIYPEDVKHQKPSTDEENIEK
jgi:hypothetical protein